MHPVFPISMANCPLEVKFAQNLAANEKKTRDKSLKKLKKYLRLKSSKKDGFVEEDFLKLWKGLHYCLWMQDKPLIQEELSSTLSKLVQDLHTAEARFLFLRTFFITEAREWNSIDIWRIDKFMMLMRNLLHELLLLAQTENWSDYYVTNLVNIITDVGMNHLTDSIPDGIRIHLADIYLDELEKVTDEELDGRILLKLLEPFTTYILKAQNTAIVKRVISRVFEPIIKRAVNILQDNEGREDTEEIDTIEYRDLKFDNNMLADHLFELSSGNECRPRNRPLVYDIVKKLRDAEEGVLPKDNKVDIKPGITYQDVNEAVQSLAKFQDIERQMKKKEMKKKKKKLDGKENVDANNNAEGAEDSGTDDESNETPTNSADHKRKRKHSLETVTAESEGLHDKVKKKHHIKHSDKGNQEDEAQQESISLTKQSLISDAAKSSRGSLSAAENSSGDNHKQSPRKRKSSDDLGINSAPKRANADTENSECAIEGESSLKDAKSENVKKRKKSGDSFSSKSTKKQEFKTVIHVRKDAQNEKKKSVWTETPISLETKSTDSEHVSKTEALESSLSQKETLTNLGDAIPPANNTTAKLEHNKSDSVKKKRSKQTPDKSKGKLENSSKSTSDIGTVKSSLDTEVSGSSNGKIPVSDDLQEGEIEIWIPNKKYKEKKQSGAGFAKFEKVKPPAAFVKKALTKVKKQSPKQAIAESKETDKTTASAKKVKFDMKKNKALAFKDSLNISPVFPFHPDKKPDQGILKSTPEGTTPVQKLHVTRKGSSTSKQSLVQGHNSSSMKSSATPVSSLTFQQKKKGIRAKAADFFLL